MGQGSSGSAGAPAGVAGALDTHTPSRRRHQRGGSRCRPGRAGPVEALDQSTRFGAEPVERPGRDRGTGNPFARVCLHCPGTAEGPNCCWCALGREEPLGAARARVPAPLLRAAPAHAGDVLERGQTPRSRPRPGDCQLGAAAKPLLFALGRGRARRLGPVARGARSSPVPRRESDCPGCCQELLPVQELRPLLNQTFLSGPGRVQRGFGRQS